MTVKPAPLLTLNQKILLGLLRLLLHVLLRVETTGLENIPGSGPVIIIINHIAFLDPVVVCGIAPRLIIPMAKKEAFDSVWLGPLLRAYGAIPVQRGEADLRAIKSTLHMLAQGSAILMAPEGTRSPNYQLQPAKEGAALIALKSGAIVVPVGVTGTQCSQAHWLKFKRPPVQISIGKPVRLRATATSGRVSRAQLSLIAQELMHRLARQLPPEFQGIYGHEDMVTESYLLPVEEQPSL
jgi:1-acyl-sn-glycerol-3-phosphate acyltransferase